MLLRSHRVRCPSCPPAVLFTVLAVVGVAPLIAPPRAEAAASILFASVSAQGTADCSSTSNACTLTTALSMALAGDAIELVTGGDPVDSATWYSGGFKVHPTGTSASLPLTIEPAPGVVNPVLDGGAPRPS